MFRGLWVLPLGLRVGRSGLPSRFPGVWLFVNGLAYMAISSTGVLRPQHVRLVFTVAAPILFGELAFTFWLLIAGVRQRPATAAAP